MLPPDPEHFVGRDDDLDRLNVLVARDKARRERRRMPARVSIVGVAGVGKSALGTRFAYSVENEYPHGALYVNLNYAAQADGDLDVSQIIRRFLLELDLKHDELPGDATGLRVAFVKATDTKRLIVFLDNVRNYQSIEDLIPRSSTCLVIVTSQERLSGDIQRLELKPLPDDAAIQLISTIAASRIVADPVASTQLIPILRACAGLPIAIVVLAARLEYNPSYPLTRLLDALDTYLSPDTDGYISQVTAFFGASWGQIEACFRVGYDALTEVQSQAFRRLSVVPGESFDVQMCGFLTDLEADRARLVLDQLRELQLIQATQDPDFFTMHSLLRQFAWESMTRDEASEQLARVLEFSCQLAVKADLVIRSLEPVDGVELPSDHAERRSRERDMALTWMEQQHRNLAAAVEQACASGNTDIAWQLCRALVAFFEIRAEWEIWRQTHEAAEKVVPKLSPGYAHVSYGLARFHGSRHHWPEAISYYRTAIAVFQRHLDQLGVGRSLNALGDVYRYMRNWDAAENCLRRSIAILDFAEDPRQLAIAKRSMAAIHRLRGEFDKGEELCLDAIESLEKLRDERWIAAAKLSLADIYLDSGHRDPLELLCECLRVFTIFKDAHWLTLTRRSLADALREEGQFDQAMTELQRCLVSLRREQDDQWEGEVLHSIGLVHLARNEVDRARSHFDQALAKFQRGQDLLWEGRTYVSIGRTADLARRVDPDRSDYHAQEAENAYHAAWPLLVEQGARADLERLEALMSGDEAKGTDGGADDK